MNIETLRVFRDLSDTGSFSTTAAMNYISQSAVSQQIKKLELVLKTKLYRRQSGRIILTPCGEKLYEASRRITEVYDGALKEIRSLGGRQAESIKISSIYSAGIYVVQDYVRQFLARNPTAKVSVEYRQFTKVFQDVSSGRADFGFLACPYQRSPGLAMLPVAEEEMVVIAGPGSPLAGRRTVDVSELAGMDFIFFDRGFPSRRCVDEFLQNNKVKGTVRMELDNIETIKTAVSAGAGVSIVPRSAVRAGEDGTGLHMLRFSGAGLKRQIYLIYNKARKLGPAGRGFLSIFSGARKAAPARIA
mgnify:CR=1 FL=1